jgi:hypothetical protein
MTSSIERFLRSSATAGTIMASVRNIPAKILFISVLQPNAAAQPRLEAIAKRRL